MKQYATRVSNKILDGKTIWDLMIEGRGKELKNKLKSDSDFKNMLKMYIPKMFPGVKTESDLERPMNDLFYLIGKITVSNKTNRLAEIIEHLTGKKTKFMELIDAVSKIKVPTIRTLASKDASRRVAEKRSGETDAEKSERERQESLRAEFNKVLYKDALKSMTPAQLKNEFRKILDRMAEKDKSEKLKAEFDRIIDEHLRSVKEEQERNKAIDKMLPLLSTPVVAGIHGATLIRMLNTMLDAVSAGEGAEEGIVRGQDNLRSFSSVRGDVDSNREDTLMSSGLNPEESSCPVDCALEKVQRIYKNLFDELTFDQAEGDKHKSPLVMDMPIAEVVRQDVQVTRETHRGVCRQFANRLVFELLSNGIWSRPIIVDMGDTSHIAALYRLTPNSGYFVADLGTDLQTLHSGNLFSVPVEHFVNIFRAHFGGKRFSVPIDNPLGADYPLKYMGYSAVSLERFIEK